MSVWWLWLACHGAGTPAIDPPTPAPEAGVLSPAEPSPAPLPIEPISPAPLEPTNPPDLAGLADGQACTAASQCASGACEGQGCGDDTPGVCVGSMRRCTRDLRPYCGCDGKTFMASGTCPNRRFASRAPCP